MDEAGRRGHRCGADIVSCAPPTFCVAADTKGNALYFNGSSWIAPAPQVELGAEAHLHRQAISADAAGSSGPPSRVVAQNICTCATRAPARACSSTRSKRASANPARSPLRASRAPAPTGRASSSPLSGLTTKSTASPVAESPDLYVCEIVETKVRANEADRPHGRSQRRAERRRPGIDSGHQRRRDHRRLRRRRRPRRRRSAGPLPPRGAAAATCNLYVEHYNKAKAAGKSRPGRLARAGTSPTGARTTKTTSPTSPPESRPTGTTSPSCPTGRSRVTTTST